MSELAHGENEAEIRVLRGLRLALELSFVILVVELIGAYYSRSLSVTVDAVHNIPDLLAFAVSWTALRACETGASGKYTFGTHRFEVFAGLLNAVLVLGTGVAFGYEALSGLVRGAPFAGSVDAVWLIVVALPVLALRAVNLSVLGRIPRRARDLNLSSVVLHLASDLAITGAILAAGVVLLLRPQFWWADAGAALVIAGILAYESFPLFREAWEVLTERTPRNLSTDRILRSAMEVPGVSEIHDLHVWAVCPTLVCMTAHVQLREMPLSECAEVVSRLRTRMEEEFGILHSVFEVEPLTAS
ncbi:MAG: cation diffusion facilitator family transporter [Thermoplasmata archaeon]|nr:cation diffusion facilitator family transporter [Thermoplasmata archaeon]